MTFWQWVLDRVEEGAIESVSKCDIVREDEPQDFPVFVGRTR